MYTVSTIVRNLALVSSLLAAAFVGRANAQEMQTLTVCEVMEKLDALSGKLVAVRGEYYFGREVAAVGDRSCKITFEVQGRKWPNAIWLGDSPSPSPSPSPSAADTLVGTIDSRERQILGRSGEIIDGFI
ncbi:MAG TPA: hypothetical protein VE422_07605 [Terriglobia bacterium]|nr:hypothetical protein [Terriglobia bacterium]